MRLRIAFGMNNIKIWLASYWKWGSDSYEKKNVSSLQKKRFREDPLEQENEIEKRKGEKIKLKRKLKKKSKREEKKKKKENKKWKIN